LQGTPSVPRHHHQGGVRHDTCRRLALGELVRSARRWIGSKTASCVRAWGVNIRRVWPSARCDHGTDELIVEAALPGVRPEDVEITVEDGTLSIRAESHSERTTGEGETLVAEIRRGSVSRVIALPTGLEPDKASATFDNGMLTLRIPERRRSAAPDPHHPDRRWRRHERSGGALPTAGSPRRHRPGR
jgi:HSP20 family molecular chaperone IbpA